MLRSMLAVCLAFTCGVGLAAAAATTPEPLWSCPGKDVPHYKIVNDCRAACMVGKDAAEAECRATAKTCREECKGGDDPACGQKCLDAAEACIKGDRARRQSCLDACVTDNGCVL